MNNIVLILAAGQGTRMKSKIPKVLHEVMGQPMLTHVVDVSKALEAKETIVIIGHGSDLIKEKMGNELKYAYQTEQLGTGHAVMMAKEFIERDSNILILYGDTPLIKENTLKDFIDFHVKNENALSVLSMIANNPYGYGRLVRDNTGKLLSIVEQKDASEDEKVIKEVNTGIYIINSNHLLANLDNLKNNNSQKEYYLTDMLAIFNENGLKIDAFKSLDEEEFMGVNDRIGLSKANEILRKRINEKHMIEGVTLLDPLNTYIEKNVKIGQDTVIYPNTHLKGTTNIGTDCVLGPNITISDSILNSGITIVNSTVTSSTIDDGTKIGPYAYLRPGSNIGKHVKIGDFVEIKNSNIGDETKISHLTYVGDSDLGRNVNLGCGVVFVNYDGMKKSRSIVGDNSFIGCNVNIVSPVVVEENSYIAAGSTITMNVPKNSLAIAREKQRNIENWVTRKRG
jgi:bifunctional UDP-N-acetylglucosamine pyrophosphorylase/glucosamine-1-phosphate N-acetyltransferase